MELLNFFNLFFIKLYQSNNSDGKFNRLVYVDLCVFMSFFNWFFLLISSFNI